VKTRAVALLTLLAVALIAMPVIAQDDSSKSEDELKSLKEDLTLKRLFEDRVPWGPSASQTAFSQDGRYGGYLYRPYDERRHGSDLWLYDTETGESMRISASLRRRQILRNAPPTRSSSSTPSIQPSIAPPPPSLTITTCWTGASRLKSSSGR